MRIDDMYIGNLAFLLNYDLGETNSEIEYEIFKVAFQDVESVHYDRQMGGNFKDLEQEPNNLAVGLTFVTNLVRSMYYVNQEKNSEPYIVIGSDSVNIQNEVSRSGNDEYVVEVKYMLMQDLNKEGTVTI
jgi:hypothetical protein